MTLNMYTVTIREFFTPALTGDSSLESEWHAFSDLQNYSNYSRWSKQLYGLNDLDFPLISCSSSLFSRYLVLSYSLLWRALFMFLSRIYFLYRMDFFYHYSK